MRRESIDVCTVQRERKELDGVMKDHKKRMDGLQDAIQGVKDD